MKSKANQEQSVMSRIYHWFKWHLVVKKRFRKEIKEAEDSLIEDLINQINAPTAFAKIMESDRTKHPGSKQNTKYRLNKRDRN